MQPTNDQPRTCFIPCSVMVLGFFLMFAAGCSIQDRLVPAAINRLTITYSNPTATDASSTTNVKGKGDKGQPAGGFTRGLYRVEDENHLTLLLIDGELAQPNRLATVRMLWRPRAGATPVDPSATNATIHFIDLATGHIGIYSGAGFILPTDPPAGLGKLKVQVSQSTLELTDHAPQYPQDRARAAISGRITLARDDEGVLKAMHEVQQLVLKRLGYPRFVHNTQETVVVVGR